MKIGFIRHSKGVEKEIWDKDNRLRPLSKVGNFRAGHFAKHLSKFYERKIDFLITSDYTKNVETADFIKKALRPRNYMVDQVLNPGFDMIKFQKLIKSFPPDTERIFLVGHNPDFPMIISEMTKDKTRMPYLKKPSLVEIEIDDFPYGKICRTYNLDDGEEFPFKPHEPYFEEVGEITL